MSGAIGIDLGTTNSCMAIRGPTGVRVIDNREGQPTTPSVAQHQRSGKWMAGKFAWRTRASEPGHTYHQTKRLIGRQYLEPVVQEMMRRVGYEIVAADNGAAWIAGRADRLAPEYIAAKVLAKLKDDAEFRLGQPITKAVITVPAYFNNAQRSATMAAGKIAGLEVLQILPEPTAAAIAYGVEFAAENTTVAVYDLGGGTFDISILRVQNGEFETLATAGDAFLGGIDFDAAVVDWAIAKQSFRDAATVLTNPIQRARIFEQVEEARIDLSHVDERMINVPSVARIAKAPVHMREMLTRAQLEEIVAPLIERTRAPCVKALEAAGLAPGDVDCLVLVGGVTKMPAVAAMAQSLFGGARCVSTDPDKIVAIGAAMLAASLDGGEKITLRDVTPHAVSIEAADGALVELIPAQSKVPASVTRRVGCADADQGAVTARLVQAEDLVLGQFSLELGKGPAREARVELTVNLDASGTVHAQMRETATGRIAASPMNLISGIDERAIARLAKAHKRDRVVDTEELQRIEDVAAAAAAASPVLELEIPPEPAAYRDVWFDEDGRIAGVDEADETEITARMESGEALDDALRGLGYMLRAEPVREAVE